MGLSTTLKAVFQNRSHEKQDSKVHLSQCTRMRSKELSSGRVPNSRYALDTLRVSRHEYFHEPLEVSSTMSNAAVFEDESEKSLPAFVFLVAMGVIAIPS